MQKFTEWFKSYPVEKGVIMTPPLEAQLAVNFLQKYLLGDNWYTLNTSNAQGNTEVVFAILGKYSRKFRKEWLKFMKEERKKKKLESKKEEL